MKIQRPLLYPALVCLILSLLATVARAQTEEQSTGEQLENFFRDNDQASESDVQQLLERLEDLRNHPLNLNVCTKEELSDMRLLNALQIESFLSYRTAFGPFINNYELQAIPNWDAEDVRKILQFATTDGSLESRTTNLADGLFEGQNELLLRWGRPVPTNYGDQLVEGSPNAFAVRYRHSFDNRLRLGFTLENDPGEAFFKGSNRRGFDFLGVHLFGQNINKRIKTLAIGDYSARFGQGLLLQTGFAAGKSAETTTIARGGRKINYYSAFGENFFFRGLATTLTLTKHLELTALYSNRRKDGNITAPADTLDQDAQELAFSSLQTSGLHRTPSEVEDEKALREQVVGLSLTYSGRQGYISANGLHLAYNHPWQPSEAAYRKYVFRGGNLTGVSVDYNWRQRNWFVFGETARSDNGAMATVNGLLFSPERHVTLTAVQRSLSPEYQSVYAMPFSEVNGAANEQALYLGADIRFIRRWQINLYSDVYRHPWLRFGVSGPSQGRDFLARVNWQRNKILNMYVQWQSETKERDSDLENITGLVENRRDRFRIHAAYKVGSGAELRSRVEWTTFKVANNPRSHGYLAYQEAVWKPLSLPISGSLRYAIYSTDNFDTRVFAYENDLFSAVSIPAFSGTGARYYINLKYRVNRHLRLEGRFEQTVQRVAVTSTNFTGRDTYYKLLARIKW